MFNIQSNSTGTTGWKYGLTAIHTRAGDASPWIPAYPGEKLSDRFPIRILIVDDNEINLKLITLQFKLQGYCVDVATNGYFACEMAADDEYDLICMDINMPVMDGFEASRKILENAVAVEPYIVAVSSCDFEEVQNELVKAGIREFLTKPVSTVKLQQLIIKTARMMSFFSVTSDQ